MLCPQNRTAHCTSHTRAPQKPRRPFRSAVCPCRGLDLRTNAWNFTVCPHRGPILRTNGRKTEVCPHGGLVLRTNGGRRRFFGKEYCTNRPLVACSAVNPLNNSGVYGTKLPWAAVGDVWFTGRRRERLGGIGKDREDKQQRAVPAAGWAGLLRIRSISCQDRPIFDQPGTSQRSSSSGITAMTSPSYPAPIPYG